MEATYQILNTKDGSNTILHPTLDEPYHSKMGALSETNHVYIKHGLEKVINTKPEITILEVGFGTGLNLLATLDFVMKNEGIKIKYIALEPFPLPKEIILSLDYKSYFPDAAMWFNMFYRQQFPLHISYMDRLKLEIHKSRLEKFDTKERFDLVYFDAFGESKQPGIWSYTNCKKLHVRANPGCLLTTYAANTKFIKLLEGTAWDVTKIEGPPGKREMINALWVDRPFQQVEYIKPLQPTKAIKKSAKNGKNFKAKGAKVNNNVKKSRKPQSKD